MNKHTKSFTKKIVTIIILLILLLSITITSFGFTMPNSNLNLGSVMSTVTKRNNDIQNYTNYFSDFSSFTQRINPNISTSDAKTQMLNQLGSLQQQNSDTSALSLVTAQLSNSIINSDATSTTDLLGSLTGIISSLGGSTSNALKSLTPDVEVTDMVATTAGKLSGDEYKVKLSGKIYYAGVNRNGQPKSDKWVVLVHGFLMNGQAIADVLGQMYLDQGINVLAPDLRGFGDSEGSVAMGYLESLDVWDWLTYLNQHYPNNCNEVFVHGVSLGGATTVFLSGLEVDGKTLKDQNVIGLVEDCGFTSMTGIVTDMINLNTYLNTDNLGTLADNELVATILGIADKTDLSTLIPGADTAIDELAKTLIIDLVNVGLTEDNYDTLSNALNSLNNSSTPLLIIHGTSDTTVPFKNSTEIYNAAMQNPNIPYVQRFEAEGGAHAFITMGTKYNVYEGHVQNFVAQAESVAKGNRVNKESTYQEEPEEEASLLTSLLKILTLLTNILGIEI